MELTPVKQEPSSEAVPVASKQELDTIEKHSLALYGELQRNAALLAMDMHYLYEGGIHLFRGFSQFGEYIESTFDGMNKNTAYQLNREGAVLVALETSKRIHTKDKKQIPGMTGLRALAMILNKQGLEQMFAAYDAAMEHSGRITEKTVAAAVKMLEMVKMTALGEGSEDALPIPVETDDKDMPVDDDDDEPYPELRDRLQDIQDTIYSVSDSLACNDLQDAKEKAKEAVTAIESVAGDIP